MLRARRPLLLQPPHLSPAPSIKRGEFSPKRGSASTLGHEHHGAGRASAAAVANNKAVPPIVMAAKYEERRCG